MKNWKELSKGKKRNVRFPGEDKNAQTIHIISTILFHMFSIFNIYPQKKKKKDISFSASPLYHLFRNVYVLFLISKSVSRF